MSSKVEIFYMMILFGLFVIPKVLQRFRLPSAITSFILGSVFAVFFPDIFQTDVTLKFFATFGIVALFLFAGLDANVLELKKEKTILIQHLVIGAFTIAITTLLVRFFLNLDTRLSLLVTLALVTPSTGFILDSIKIFGFSPQENFWIKMKAVSFEILALCALMVCLQSVSWQQFIISIMILGAMTILLPLVFKGFARSIVPHAPNSEFTFLLITAVACALITKHLGVYYLVGAFVVGVAAQRFREEIPSIASEKMIDAIELFASFFVPFYFFHAGGQFSIFDFDFASLMLGVVFCVVLVPIRMGLVVFHRRIKIDEDYSSTQKIAVTMLPTLVFTIVLATIAKTSFGLSQTVFNALIFYTVINTLIPGFLFKMPTPEYETPEALELEEIEKT